MMDYTSDGDGTPDDGSSCCCACYRGHGCRLIHTMVTVRKRGDQVERDIEVADLDVGMGASNQHGGEGTRAAWLPRCNDGFMR
jgi:hypothetical protein